MQGEINHLLHTKEFVDKYSSYLIRINNKQ